MHLLRILAAIAAIASGVWVGNADWSAGIPFDAVISLISTFGGYITFEWVDRDVNDRISKAEATPKASALSQHDIALGRRLRRAFPQYTQRLLREHPMGSAIHHELVEPLQELAYEWQGVNFEMDDDAMGLQAKRVVDAINEFLGKLAASSVREGEMYVVPTQDERARDHFYDWTVRDIEFLELKAREVLETHAVFERAFRARLEASAQMNRLSAQSDNIRSSGDLDA